ncbi:MAG: intramembrane metalloprotease PrsW [Paenibacillaceae bacterium]|nr:intramembrane metalloprotease PrsW [Paenibacillaceae bacterium]
MMLSILIAAIAPGIALLSYFYLKDRYEPEPISMVAKLFVFGALLVFPTMVLQRSLVLGIGGEGEHPLLFSFVISAVIEEFLKWFIIYFFIYKHTVFDEPYDGIVYAVAAALGFATMENVLYAIVGFPSFSNLLYRALLPVSGHALFGVMMGYHLGKAKFNRLREKRYLVYSLVFPIVYHGLFDYILLMKKQYWVWLITPLMAYLWIRSMLKVKRANARSPLRVVRREEEINI